MRFTSKLEYTDGEFTIHADSINDVNKQINLLKKIANSYGKTLQIPDLNTIYKTTYSVGILIIEILKNQRPIKNIEQLLSEELYRQLTYRIKLDNNKIENLKTLPNLNTIYMQVNVIKNYADVTLTVKDGEKNRAFALKVENKKNKWIVTELEYA
ncbi:hypothetical protein HCQ94_04345 [Actinomyces sp. zg-332]|uniref:Rv3235 family protein n=1 Tax=Actinomyces sp. zg-332 TaxID=2708340 RepID=UPI00141E0135|nr:Rv3235 family protein [Actinomyces sp. zg-332]QPK93823.1 hypothetical protein HCQ94_04345 [Actinomyces sp. zg-332]